MSSTGLDPELAKTVADLEQLPPEARRIVRDLVALLRSRCSTGEAPGASHTLLELKGLGKEIWQDESAEDYVRRERESWGR